MRLLSRLTFATFLLAASAAEQDGCPNILTRLDWGGIEAKEVEYSTIPVRYVVIHHTVTPECENEDDCAELISNMQTFHMDTLKFHDIGYNFLIGGDGNVYEGVGWHKIGAHTSGYNSRSVGVAFVGNFTSKLPNEAQRNAAKKLLECGVSSGELDERYKLIGARQVSQTQSPGLKLYREIQRWPHFARSP